MGKRALSVFVAFVLIFMPFTNVLADKGYVSLELGSRGEQVSQLQQELQNQGYFIDSVDGIYGPITKQAVIDFQRNNGLSADGIAGANTQSLLYGESKPYVKEASASSNGYITDEEL